MYIKIDYDISLYGSGYQPELKISEYNDKIYYSINYSSLHQWEVGGWGAGEYGITNWNEFLKVVVLF